MWPWMGKKWGPPGDENFLYLYGSHLSNLVVLLFYSFVRCYYWQKLSEEYVVFLCVIARNYKLHVYNYKLHANLQLSQNKTFN